MNRINAQTASSRCSNLCAWFSARTSRKPQGVVGIFCVALLFCLLGEHSIQAQQRNPGRPPQTVPPSSALPAANAGNAGGEGLPTNANRDYLIAAGDVVEVWVQDAPEFSRNYRVNAAGEFSMDVVGRIAAKEKTTEELAALIAEKLRVAEYLNQPNVVVSVRQYNSQTFIIQGTVNKPGVYQLEGRPDLLGLIGLAGGLNEAHGSTAFILRPKTEAETAKDSQAAGKATPEAETTARSDQPGGSDDGQNQGENQDEAGDYELIRVNLSALYKGHFEHNQVLKPRDIINIPRADVFFVAGEVNAPGSFILKEGTTLRQAISLAQGPTFKAKTGNCVIFREDPDNGKRQEIRIDIGAVMNGKQEDQLILANDVIIVPNSRTKSISSALLSALGMSAARVPIRY